MNTPSTRLRIGDVAYLRVRFVGKGFPVNPADKEPKATVEVINRVGFSRGSQYEVNESDLVTPADAMRAVRGARV